MRVPTPARFGLNAEAQRFAKLMLSARGLARQLSCLAAGDGDAEAALFFIRNLQEGLASAWRVVEPLCPPDALGRRPPGQEPPPCG